MTAGPPNPLSEPPASGLAPDPAVMVVFGASGDLAGRKLLPSLYNLFLAQMLPAGTSILGAALDDLSDEEFRRRAAESVRSHSRTQPVDAEGLRSFLALLTYRRLAFDDAAGFRSLRRTIDAAARSGAGGNALFYCATPPAVVPMIVEGLRASGLARPETGWRRIVLEKPFGTDLESARELNRLVTAVFPEAAVFRIDHYLGKETVQNILSFRFANAVFEPVWNSHYVDSVQVTVAEDGGVEQRGAYYDRAGAIRDIVQNHLLQVVSLVAMEPPAAFDEVSVRDEKVKLLGAIRPFAGAGAERATVRAQYGPGWVLGEEARGYRQEANVAPGSDTETYVALRLAIDNWRWAGVPFFVRTGKRLRKRLTEVRVIFKRPPPLALGRSRSAADPAAGLDPNAIVIRIQPEEGISLRFAGKVPAAGMRLQMVNMDFLYLSSFMIDVPDAYERLIVDCLAGDATLFIRADEAERAWALVDPIVERWRGGRPPLDGYAAGGQGPRSADRLLAREGRRWQRI